MPLKKKTGDIGNILLYNAMKLLPSIPFPSRFHPFPWVLVGILSFLIQLQFVVGAALVD